MTSLLLIFRFPNPDRGSAAKHILESFSKRQRRKDMLTNCQLIVAVSKRFHLMVSHSIVWYCMVFLHCMPTHLWCIKAVSLLLPCRRPVIPPVSLTALCHSHSTGKGTVYTNTQKYIHIYKIQIEID